MARMFEGLGAVSLSDDLKIGLAAPLVLLLPEQWKNVVNKMTKNNICGDKCYGISAVDIIFDQ